MLQAPDKVNRFANRTSDAEAAHEYVAVAFAPHDLRLDDAHALDVRLDVTATDRVAVGTMSYGTGVTMHAPPMGQCYHLNFPTLGQTTVANGKARRCFSRPGTGVALGPTAPVFIRWSADSRHDHLNLSRESLEVHAARLVGGPVDGDLGFDLTFDLSTPRAQTLLSMVRFLGVELAREGGIASVPVALRELESALMTQVLMAVPNRLSAVLDAPGGYDPRRRIRDAAEFLQAHVLDEICVGDVAVAARLSVRALQVGFRQQMGESPMEFLRGLRLEGAHQDLVLRTGTVGEVANRWHFHHLGRFASLYRSRFGMSPSDVLRGRGERP